MLASHGPYASAGSFPTFPGPSLKCAAAAGNPIQPPHFLLSLKPGRCFQTVAWLSFAGSVNFLVSFPHPSLPTQAHIPKSTTDTQILLLASCISTRSHTLPCPHIHTAHRTPHAYYYFSFTPEVHTYTCRRIDPHIHIYRLPLAHACSLTTP